MHQKELTKKQREKKQDELFAQARPMIVPRKTWREKRLAKEENGNEEASEGKDQPNDV
jgi:hypothetical protein